MSDKIKQLLAKAQAQGSSMSSVARAECDFSGDEEAQKQFDHFKEKLLRVERWNAHSALMSFALFDRAGNKCGREQAAVGDFIRLMLAASGKDDWVSIVSIDESANEMILTVRPARNPSEPNEAVTSHFFTVESSNNFCLERNDKKINFYVIGLNEKTNTSDTKNIFETVRNAATANLGRYLGIQKMEWTQFCENFLKN